eukprot:CAMPEP_0178686366 /NCGR_PEP_ID=MMETSP0699-20121125/3883_1 /TAXON_ID=265572 /ORGANISM="Extubocellulus spinifer, Strain CCMP396" /LENGTH=357 /DNA_ID=CAMNT_0020331191 /DNA_START=40 /DNA_END=1113 /DNA_ORIENTATION=+
MAGPPATALLSLRHRSGTIINRASNSVAVLSHRRLLPALTAANDDSRRCLILPYPSRSMVTSCISSCPLFYSSSNYQRQQCRSMAGHNKWSKIKRKKGANDAARSTAHGKAAKAIQAAARRCGGDMDDMQLQSTIAAAKAVQLPKDRIESAIERGTNPTKFASEELTDMRYDGVLPTKSGKVAVIVTALTDNKNRTASNVRASFSKCGGEMLGTGAHEWMFDHIGLVIVPMGNGQEGFDGKTSVEEEEEALMEYALDGGATDVEFLSDADEAYDEQMQGPYAAIRCHPSDLHTLLKSLQNGGYEILEFDTRYVVKNEETGTIELSTEAIGLLEKLLRRMDEDDDVTTVFHNAVYLEH